MSKPQLSAEDQARVDDFIRSGYNDVERKPFRPMMLLLFLFIVVSALGGLAYLIALLEGVV